MEGGPRRGAVPSPPPGPCARGAWPPRCIMPAVLARGDGRGVRGGPRPSFPPRPGPAVGRGWGGRRVPGAWGEPPRRWGRRWGRSPAGRPALGRVGGGDGGTCRRQGMSPRRVPLALEVLRRCRPGSPAPVCGDRAGLVLPPSGRLVASRLLFGELFGQPPPALNVTSAGETES